ncbi:MAG: hypothetical protein HC875_08540 [Anaerolineales bacterium]|nr:hypothetical protein [Anaerolineales bacterium]
MAFDTLHLVDTNQIEWEEVTQPWYTQPIRRKVLRRDPDTGRTHLLVTYPAGLNAPVHRHSLLTPSLFWKMSWSSMM